jgi:hypothetical protein
MAIEAGPRHELAGADLDRVIALQAIRSKDGSRMPELPVDVEALERVIRGNNVVLVGVDPLVAFLDANTSAINDKEVPRALAPLAALAGRTRATVVAVRHLNKGGGSNPLYRGGGSIGIIAAARAGLLVAVDPDDPDLRVLAVTKMNLGVPGTSLSFKIVGDPDGVATTQWTGKAEHDAASLLADPEDVSTLDAAREFLGKLLKDGSKLASEVETAAKVAGISTRTLRRARKELAVCARKRSFSGKRTLELPR